MIKTILTLILVASVTGLFGQLNQSNFLTVEVSFVGMQGILNVSGTPYSPSVIEQANGGPVDKIAGLDDEFSRAYLTYDMFLISTTNDTIKIRPRESKFSPHFGLDIEGRKNDVDNYWKINEKSLDIHFPCFLASGDYELIISNVVFYHDYQYQFDNDNFHCEVNFVNLSSGGLVNTPATSGMTDLSLGSYTISNSNQLLLDTHVTPASCDGQSGGIIDLSSSPNYTVTWSIPSLTQTNEQNVPVGIYHYELKENSNDCVYSSKLYDNPVIVTRENVEISAIDIYPASCNGIPNGACFLHIEQTFLNENTIYWDTPGTGHYNTKLSSGQNSVRITSNDGSCETSLQFGVEFPYQLNPQIEIEPSCQSNGKISVIEPSNPFSRGTLTYTISNSNGTVLGAEKKCLDPGNYFVQVKDSAFCQFSQNVIVPSTNTQYDYQDNVLLTAQNSGLIDANNDGVILIRGRIFVESGAHTLQNLILRFDNNSDNNQPDLPNNGIVVKNGATLVLRNCDLSSICGLAWDGIEVWGNPIEVPRSFRPGEIVKIDGFPGDGFDIPVPTSFYDSLGHGALIVENSIITNAYQAISMFKERVNQNDPDYVSDFGRGSLVALNSTFKNNIKGIVFDAFAPYTSDNLIRECNFSSDSPVEFCEGSQYATDFIEMTSVYGVKIEGNTFTCDPAFNIDNKPVGILSYDGSYNLLAYTGPLYADVITPNTFINLKRGVEAYSIGGFTPAIRINDNKFINTRQAITMLGGNYHEIQKNTITVPEGNALHEGWGIYLLSTGGAIIENNTLQTSSYQSASQRNLYKSGYINSSSRELSNLITNNLFKGDYYSATQVESESVPSANQPENNLIIDCNEYDGENNHDWLLLSTLNDQGTCTNTSSNFGDTRNNIFDPCINEPNDAQITNGLTVIDVSDFTYYAGTAAPSPSCVSNGVFVITCTGLPTGRACADIGDPCVNCETEPVSALQSIIDNSINPEKVLYTILNRLVAVDDIVKALVLLNEYQSRTAFEMVIPTLVVNHNYSSAREMLSAYNAQSPNIDAEFSDLFDIIIRSGEITGNAYSVDSLSQTDSLFLVNLANMNTYNGNIALAFLTRVNKGTNNLFPMKYIVPSSMHASPVISQQSNQSISVKVYPQPGDDNVFISLLNKNSSSMGIKAVRILDMNGKVLQPRINLNEGIAEIIGLSYGVYLTEITMQNGEKVIKKIVMH